MDDSPFRFKQFSIAQDKGAMKVNTDGVLLGAWADVSEARSILDIGTGTGVIALMMAQRNSEATIDAIDIDEDAYNQAKENFEQSKWNERLNAFHSALQKFTLGKKYDAIVSNPPYFIDDFKTDNQQRNVARHSLALSYEELLSGVNRLLSEKGKVFVVIPDFNHIIVESIARKEQFFITKVTDVIAVNGKKPYLALLQLEKVEKEILKNQIVIQNEKRGFTEEYISLTKEFYLKF